MHGFQGTKRNQPTFLSHEFTDEEYFMFVYFRLTKARHIVCHVFPEYSETSTNTDYLYREDEISQVYHLQCNQKRKKKDWNRIFRFKNKQVAIACANISTKVPWPIEISLAKRYITHGFQGSKRNQPTFLYNKFIDEECFMFFYCRWKRTSKTKVAWHIEISLAERYITMDFKVVNEISQPFFLMNSLTTNVWCFLTSGWRRRGILYALFSPDYSDTSTNSDCLHREDEILQVHHLQCN